MICKAFGEKHDYVFIFILIYLIVYFRFYLVIAEVLPCEIDGNGLSWDK